MCSVDLHRRLLLASALAAAWGAAPQTAPAQEAGTVERQVTFSEQQAESGRAAYRRYCVECHGPDLDDGEFGGPPLRGLQFEEMFGGLPVSALYNYILATMPPDRPGRISDEDRTEIVAYLLQRNGYPDGTPLPENVAAMENLIVEK